MIIIEVSGLLPWTFRAVANLGNVTRGRWLPVERTISSADMPRSRHEYQGSSFSNRTFTTQVSGGEGGGGAAVVVTTPEVLARGKVTPIEESRALVPGGGPPEGEPGEPEGEELVPLEEEEVPGGPVKLPKTGETPPFLFYGLGLTLVAGGVALGRKRNKQDYKE